MSLTSEFNKALVYRQKKLRLLERFGMRLLLDNRNWIDSLLTNRRLYETRQLQQILQFISERQASHFFDIGANFGLYSIYLAQHAAGLKHIHAFEPDRRNHHHLCGNLFCNQLESRIHVHSFGLSDQAGEVAFITAPASSTGTSHVATPAEKAAAAPLISIPVKTLDECFPELRGASLVLKIDVEGHEQAVLQGARQTLANNRCLIQMEVWPESQSVMLAWVKAHLGLQVLLQIDNDFYLSNDRG